MTRTADKLPRAPIPPTEKGGVLDAARERWHRDVNGTGARAVRLEYGDLVYDLTLMSGDQLVGPWRYVMAGGTACYLNPATGQVFRHHAVAGWIKPARDPALQAHRDVLDAEPAARCPGSDAWATYEDEQDAGRELTASDVLYCGECDTVVPLIADDDAGVYKLATAEHDKRGRLYD